MKSFLTLLFGQLASNFGTQMTQFAVGIWVYNQTGSATDFSLALVASFLPSTLLSPVAGVVADRMDRRLLMMLSDSAAGICTLSLVGLLYFGTLEVWHVYVLAGLFSITSAFHWPAYRASFPMLVPKEKLDRANALTQAGAGLVSVMAPAIAGVLLVQLGLEGIVILDFITFLFGVLTLAVVKIPSPDEPHESTEIERSSYYREFRDSLSFIMRRRGLLALLGFVFVTNFLSGQGQALVTPMILAFSSADGAGLAWSVAGSGLMLSSIYLAIRGGPKKQIHGVVFAGIVMGLGLISSGLRANLPLIMMSMFVIMASVGVIGTCDNTIWQRKVPTHMQGRVFALKEGAYNLALLLGYAVSGPIGENILEPALAPGGALASSVGLVIGLGAGRGLAFLTIIAGVFFVAVAVVHARMDVMMNLEERLPDFDDDSVTSNRASMTV